MSELTPEKIAWAKSLIQPDLPEYDEKDHQIAMLRFVIWNLHEEIADLWCSSDMGLPRQGPITLEDLQKEIRELIFPERLNGESRLPDGTDMGILEEYAKERNWESLRDDHLTGWHCGDCTAVSASCTKCYVEPFYDINTPFEGKAAGWEALDVFTKARETNNSEETKS